MFVHQKFNRLWYVNQSNRHAHSIAGQDNFLESLHGVQTVINSLKSFLNCSGQSTTDVQMQQLAADQIDKLTYFAETEF